MCHQRITIRLICYRATVYARTLTECVLRSVCKLSSDIPIITVRTSAVDSVQRTHSAIAPAGIVVRRAKH
jgi:hypothetical protein